MGASSRAAHRSRIGSKLLAGSCSLVLVELSIAIQVKLACEGSWLLGKGR
jgi:hypothetical protein